MKIPSDRLRGMFPQDSDDIWQYVHRVKLDLLAADDGELMVSFEIHGSTGLEEDEDGELTIKHHNGDEIVQKLLSRFHACRKDGGQ